MARELKAERAVLSEDLLDRGVNEAGWIAVVHADGNGVGKLFSKMHKVVFRIGIQPPDCRTSAMLWTRWRGKRCRMRLSPSLIAPTGSCRS